MAESPIRRWERAKKRLAKARGELESATSEWLAAREGVLRELDDGPRLTRREMEVLNGIRRRLSNKEIANGLNISVRTVKHHVGNLLSKHRVDSREKL